MAGKQSWKNISSIGLDFVGTKLSNQQSAPMWAMDTGVSQQPIAEYADFGDRPNRLGVLAFLFRKLGTSTNWIATLNARNCATEVANK